MEPYTLTAEQTLGEALERIARHFPEREAIVSGPMRLTYRQWDDITNLLVTQLEILGLTKGERVGLMLPTCPQIPLVAFALAKLGVVTVLVNPMLQAQETQFVLHDSGASALVVLSQFMNRDMVAMVEEIRPNLPDLRHVILVGGRRDGYLSLDEMMAADRPAPRPSFVRPDLAPHDLAFLFYTGGTTGSPKGAMSTHHNFLFVESNGYPDKVDKCLCHLLIPPLFMTGGFAMLAGVILYGMKLVLLPGFDPRLILQAIQDEKASYFFSYPTMIRWIMGIPTFDQYDVSSVREIVLAGEPITPELVHQVRARFRCSVSTGYGMTEVRGITDFPRDVPDELAAISDGRSAAHIELRIVDKEGQEVPSGQVGEMTARGPAVFSGYWNRPDLTARAFDRDGFFHTGDLGRFLTEEDLRPYVKEEDLPRYVADHWIRFVGRDKETIRRGGVNIHPEEVENFLRTHPKVAAAGVIGVPSPIGGQRVRAYVVLRPGVEMTAVELVDYCRGQLATHKLPDEVRFVPSLPVSATQRVQRWRLREEAAKELEQGAG